MVLYNYISIIFMEKRGVYIMEITSKTESVVVKYEVRCNGYGQSPRGVKCVR